MTETPYDILSLLEPLSGEHYLMKRILALGALCLLLLAGCYVRTKFDSQNRYLPAGFSSPVLVVTLQEKVGLGEEHAARLEQSAIQALTAKGIESISLTEATKGAAADRATEVLRENNYRALLKISITSWGSKSKRLSDPIPPSVVDADSGSSTGSTFRPPGALDYGAEQPGPTTDYKQVGISGALMDLQGNRVVWSGQLSANPAVVGRSFVYHRFNRNLQYDELAEHCFRRLAKELGKALKST